MPASAVKVVEPSATVIACQSICFNVAEAPNDTDVPFTVIDEFVNFELPIVPVAILAFVTELAAKSAARTVEFSILSVVIASSAIPVF